MKKVLIVGQGKSINLQLFANLDEIITANTQAFEGSNVKDSFSAIQTKLGELGFDVLINDKKKAEFIPSTRLSEVVSQRDGFKTQVETLNTQLEALKKGAGDNEALKGEYQKLIDQNNNLLKEIETTKINTEIMLAAKDAINAKDLLVFIDMNNIKVNAKGEILGVEAEIERVKKEKPYLFTDPKGGKGGKGGSDTGGDKGDKSHGGGMNAMIRRAAGRGI
ncbi:MAG: phage scaffolding protein [Clostridia bacterium]|nr:phage scaffolding protein [Clostridia bacterium]